MFPCIAHSSPKLTTRHAVTLLALLLVIIATSGCSDDDNPMSPAPAPTNSGFVDAYALESWSASGIPGGSAVAAVVPDTDMEEARFTYDVNLGNPGGGVSHRTVLYSVEASSAGTVTVDWTYTGFHAFYQAYAQLAFFAHRGDGVEPDRVVELLDRKVSGNFSFSGSTSFEAVEGQRFGFEVGGSNYDSNSRLTGTLHVTRIVTPQ